MSINFHSISPSTVIRGKGAWNKSVEQIVKLSKKGIFINDIISY